MTPTITDDAVFTALRAFLLVIMPSGVEVVMAQDNGVSMPTGEFVSMNNTGTKRLETNITSYRKAQGLKDIELHQEYRIQLDFYGLNSAQNAATFCTLYRDEYAFDQFPDNIKPLYNDDPSQVPLMNSESQYEQRWKVGVTLQVNPTVSVPQQFMNSVAIGLTPLI